MNEPIRTQWQIRCAFNGFCKLALKREAMNAHRDTKQRQLREVTFSDLSPLEEKQLYVCDATSATSILQMMKQNSLSLSAAKKLLRSCLPKPCTVCRKKSGKPYCCIISLT